MSRWVRVKRWGDEYVVIDHRGKVYHRGSSPNTARHKLREVLSEKRGRPVTGKATDRRVEIRRRGKGYSVVDSTGRVWGYEEQYVDAYRLWRRTLKGLSKRAGEREQGMLVR